MNIKSWSTALLIVCLCPAAIAQKTDRYLEKPLPQGWGTGLSHAIPGEDNLFSRQIPPVDDQWWKAFNDPMLDSLITVASTRNYSVLSAIDRMDMAKANLRIERGNSMAAGHASKAAVMSATCPNPSPERIVPRLTPVGNLTYSAVSARE